MKWLISLGLLLSLSACALSYPGRIETIDSSDTINQGSADSAPQQTVVNGWTARDYLKLIAEQNTELALIGYGTVVGLLVLILVVLRQGRSKTLPSGSSPPTSLEPVERSPE